MEKQIQLDIGDLCDLKCRFCINYKSFDERGFVPVSVLKKALKKFAKEGYKAVDIIGGEVTMYPQIEKILEYATSLGYERINLISHGIRYSDMDFLKKIAKAGNIRFCVSFQGFKEEEEDFLISSKGGFRKKIKGLCNLIILRKQGLIKESIYLSIVITKLNYKLLPEILFFYFKNFGIKNTRFRFIIPLGNAFDNFKLLVPTYTQVMPYLKKAIILSKKMGFDISFDGIPFCILKDIKKFEDYMGEIRDDLENRKKQISLEDQTVISDKNNEIQIQIKNCKGCTYNSVCGGPFRNYIKIYGSKEFKPVK